MHCRHSNARIRGGGGAAVFLKREAIPKADPRQPTTTATAVARDGQGYRLSVTYPYSTPHLALTHHTASTTNRWSALL